MNSQFTKDNLRLESFLNGRLSEDDREEFLADYLGDANRMQQLREYLTEHQIPERFLREDLSAAERDAFEILSIADPQLFDELQLIERTKQGFQDLDKSGELPVTRSRNSWPSFFNSPVYAAAASVLLVASLMFSGVTFRDNVTLRAERTLIGDPSVPRLIPILTFRNGNAFTVSPPDADEWIVLLVDPGDTDYSSYRVTLQRLANETTEQVWQRSDVSLTYDLQLAVGVPGSLLTIGEYEILIEGQADDAALDRITSIALRVATTD